MRYPSLTRDTVTGAEMIVTRLESPVSGIVVEGSFSLGWIGRLTNEQIEFVGALVRNRGNIQKLAAELGVSYNTARNRLDDIVAVLGGPSESDSRTIRLDILDRVAAQEISFDDAMQLLRGL